MTQKLVRTRGSLANSGLALASLLALLALPGCPMSDDYFVDPSLGNDGVRGGSSNGGAASGGSSGAAPIGGGAGTEATGGSSTGGTATGGDSGMAGESSGGSAGDTGGTGAGGGPTVCDVPCNAPRTCTDGCQDGWIPTSPPPGGFSPREKAAYTSIGSQLFVWGGVNESGTALNSGALYDPRSDTWTVIETDSNTPSPRSLATAVWTGSWVIVWGGLDPVSGDPLDDGAIYDPVADAWSPMSPGPEPRAAAIGAAGSDVVVFFGGQGASSTPLAGLELYDPVTDEWEGDGLSSPQAVADPAVASGAQTFWTYGGRTSSNTAVSSSSYFSFSSERWVSADSRTPGRWGSFAAFADATFFVWGGRSLNDLYDDGAGYVLATGRWGSMEETGAPSPRFSVHRESGWAFILDPDANDLQIAFIAGLDSPDDYLNDGGLYDVATGSWEAIPAWPSPASHAFGVAGVAAGELIVWGGRDGTTLTNQGVRYRPAD